MYHRLLNDNATHQHDTAQPEHSIASISQQTKRIKAPPTAPSAAAPSPPGEGDKSGFHTQEAFIARSRRTPYRGSCRQPVACVLGAKQVKTKLKNALPTPDNSKNSCRIPPPTTTNQNYVTTHRRNSDRRVTSPRPVNTASPVLKKDAVRSPRESTGKKVGITSSVGPLPSAALRKCQLPTEKDPTATPAIASNTARSRTSCIPFNRY